MFNDPKFVQKVKERWAVIYPRMAEVEEKIRNKAAELKVSQELNIRMWPIDTRVNGDETLPYDQAIERMIENFNARCVWLNSRIQAM